VRTTSVSSRTPTPDDDADLRQHDDRQHAEHREDGGQHDAGAGDDAAGRGERRTTASRVEWPSSTSSRVRATRKTL
jgi:hypothetical protein